LFEGNAGGANSCVEHVTNFGVHYQNYTPYSRNQHPTSLQNVSGFGAPDAATELRRGDVTRVPDHKD
jgi:hypothetical protein